MHSLARLPAFVAVSLFSLWLSGCTTRVYGYTDTAAYAPGPAPAVTYVDTDPDLAVLDDGVYVVCDQPGTVYYTGGSYWYYGSGAWYRSSVWGGQRVRVGIGYVPFSLRSRAHWRYRRYDAPAHLRVRYRHGRRGHYGRSGRWGRTRPGVRVRTRGRAHAGPPSRPRTSHRRPATRRPATRPRRPDTRRPRTSPRRTMPTPRQRTKQPRRPRSEPHRSPRGRDVVISQRKRGSVTRTRRSPSTRRSGPRARSSRKATAPRRNRASRRTTVSRGGRTKVTRSRTKSRRTGRADRRKKRR